MTAPRLTKRSVIAGLYGQQAAARSPQRFSPPPQPAPEPAARLMIANSWQIVLSVLGVFLVMMLGAYCRRTGWLSREADRSLANLTAKVLLPALFIDRILSGDKFDSLLETWVPPAFGFGITVLGFLLGWMVAYTLGPRIGLTDDSSRRAFALGVGICNYGYIPLPLAEQFYESAVVPLILHNVGVDLALWSVGVAIISSGTGARRPWWKAVFSPPLLAVIFAVTLRQTGLDQSIPWPVRQATRQLGDCTIPMGLLLSGAIIIDFVRDAKWAGSFRTVAAAILFRQALMPVLMLGVAAVAIQSSEMKQVMMLEAAMPAAVFPIVLARLYDRDISTALRVVLATSIAGIVLVPTWLIIGKWFLGV